MNSRLLIIRYGELALKKRNRAYFENRLLTNLRAKLEPMSVASVRKLPGRIVVEFENPMPWSDVKDSIKKVFGYSTASPVHRTAPSMADIEKALVSEVSKLDFSSFAVRAKRSDKKFPLTSPEICVQLGAAIREKSGVRVDLNNPDKVFNIEILDRDIFFSFEKFRGPGGLPSGVSGHALSLLSGGIDSPVASWMMMKRGLKVSFIHFHSSPFTDQASIEKVGDMVGKLAEWQGGSKLVVVPFGELQKQIVTSVPAKYRVVLYRRFMLRIASGLARDVGASALVTGEAMGQVASQTLPNMASIESASSLPVLRPLIGLDKQEIVDIAKKIGTYDLSIEPHQDCCSFLQPPNPVTKTTSDELDGVESGMDIDEMIMGAIKGAEFSDLT